MRVSIDIETDKIVNNLVTKIHCLVCTDLDSDDEYPFVFPKDLEDFIIFSKRVTTWVGHNLIAFDLVWLKKFTGVSVSLKDVEDTMILSKMHHPYRDGGHSLKAWGERLKFPKSDFDDYDNYSEEMLEYCKQDTRVTKKLYLSLKPSMANWSDRSIELEYQVRSLVTQQEFNGYPIKRKEAYILQATFEDRMATVEADVRKVFRPLPTNEGLKEVKYKEDGSMYLNSYKRLGSHGKYVLGDYTFIDWPEFNLGSRPQIAKYLIKFGWEPKEFTPTGQPIVDEAHLEGVDIPEAQMICEYLMLQKRLAEVYKWIKFSELDGKVHGQVDTCRAVSNRMGHREPNLAQVPSIGSTWGKECRELFTVSDPDKYVQVGTDASGLEMRCLAHYINDPEFTDELMNGDIHTKNMNDAGLHTRDQAKTFIYAMIYGAGGGKIGEIINGTAKDGKKLIETYMNNNPKLKALKKAVETKATKTGFIPALDGRILRVRTPHASLNLLLQGCGAIICKQWLVEITKLYRKRRIDATLLASVHDEYQWEVLKDHADEFGELCSEAIKLAQVSLNVRCPLDADYKVGTNWAECH